MCRIRDHLASHLCRVPGGDRANQATDDSIIMDLAMVTVATALRVVLRQDEVVAGEEVGGVAQIGPSTPRGGAPTKSDRVIGRSPKVGGGEQHTIITCQPE